MKRMILVFGVMSFLCFSLNVCCHDALEAAAVNMVKGSIVDIDWVAGKVVVKTDDFDGPDEIVFIATHDTKITKGLETIFFSDILQGDQVAVTYTSSSLAGLTALEIAVDQ